METQKVLPLPEGFSVKTGFGGLIRLSEKLPSVVEALRERAKKQSKN